MFKQLSTALAFAPARSKRSRTPVHRNSRLAGHCEGAFWRRTTRRDSRRIVLAARRYEIANKAAGSRNGPLGSVAIEILELLANLVDYKTGRLEPSIDTLMQKLRRSRDAVVRGLKALRQHGFVDWLRRYMPTETEGDKGPQVKQTSNAYRLAMPAKAEACLDRYRTAPPLPEDREQAEAERQAVMEDFAKAEMVSVEQLEMTLDHENPVVRKLAEMRRKMLLQRESARQTESRLSNIYKREE
jgi:hypothetical protein